MRLNTNNNTPTAIIFFARPDLLKITFEAVRKAKPNQLFLIQDGARVNNAADHEKILACQKIVEDIDWECEVFRNYSSENLGCGMRVFSGISWAFQYTNRLLILEDDCVPSLSLFPFVSELLEKYQNDDRIGMISGMNNLGVYPECPNDYFFTTSGSIWGWATWKRVWDKVEYDLDFLNDKYATHVVYKTDPKLRPMGQVLFDKFKNGEKLSSWSYQLGMAILLNHQLNIVPKYNMISNIGMSEDGANSVSSLRFMPKGLRRLYYMKTYDYKFPLQHPKYVVNDLDFKKRLDRVMGDGYPFIQFFRKVESILYRIIGGDYKSLVKGLKKRLN
jgi:hypothetical protein